ncbi:MAG: PQQ-binding-like beta-propeller repeat protein [Gemmatales bacterium]
MHPWDALILVVIAQLLCTPFALAEDWPQFRGPAGLGCSQEKELPVRWGTDSTNIRWTTPIPGQGVSSPIVSQGRVYVTTAYEGEQRNPWYTLAVGLAVVTMARLVSWLSKEWRWLIHDAPGSWYRIGLVGLLGGLTVLAVALTTLIMLRPGLFWADDVRWIGATPTLDAHHPLVEKLYLRQVFVASLGSLIVVFAAVALHARRQVTGSATDPTKAPHLLALLMLALSVCCTLASIVASVLVIARPEWFWEAGQPWRVWLVSGGLGLGTVAAAVGWLPQNRPDRWVGITLVLVLAGWLYWNTPLSEINRPIDLDLRVWYVIPGCLLIASAAVVSALGLRKGWPAIPAGSRLLAVGLTALAFVQFWWANELQPMSGMLRVVVCLDARTGTVLWQTPVLVSPTEKKHTLNSYATPTPVTDGERIYADFGSSIAALNRDGRLLWLKPNPGYANFTRYGAGSSPVLANELLIVYRDREWAGHGDDPVAEDGADHPSALIAYDKLTGHERWRVTPPFSHDSYMTPLIWSNDGRSEVVVATWRTLAGFDLEPAIYVGDTPIRWNR